MGTGPAGFSRAAGRLRSTASRQSSRRNERSPGHQAARSPERAACGAFERWQATRTEPGSSPLPLAPHGASPPALSCSRHCSLGFVVARVTPTLNPGSRPDRRALDTQTWQRFLSPPPVQPLQTRHTPRGCPAPGPSSVQFSFITFATIFDQIIRWVIFTDESKDYFQNNNYRVQTLEIKAPTLSQSVRGLPVSSAQREQPSSSEGFLGYPDPAPQNQTAVAHHSL